MKRIKCGVITIKGNFISVLQVETHFKAQNTAYLLLLNFTNTLLEVKSLSSVALSASPPTSAGSFFKMLMNGSDSL